MNLSDISMDVVKKLELGGFSTAEFLRNFRSAVKDPLSLGKRQKEVLVALANGKRAKEIARDLGLSTKTVESHRYQLCQRLNLHGLAEIVHYAVRHGLIDIEVEKKATSLPEEG